VKPKAPLAYQDEDFILSKAARPVRILSEYLSPEEKLSENDIRHTIVFFGSARIAPDDSHPMYEYYHTAKDLAKEIALWSKSIENPDHKVYVCTGGGPGIMQAANRGAHEAGEQNLGLNISLPFEQEPNPYITPELSIEFHYFYMRKLWFLYHAKAIVVFPGGYGTLDELFETLTLMQTKKIQKPFLPILLYDKSYWDNLINFEFLAEKNLISSEDLKLFRFFDTIPEAMDIIKTEVTDLIVKYNDKNF
jgi:uncharacterized protein (TIGR00730 family)